MFAPSWDGWHPIWHLHGLLRICDPVQKRLVEIDKRVEDAFHHTSGVA